MLINVDGGGLGWFLCKCGIGVMDAFMCEWMYGSQTKGQTYRWAKWTDPWMKAGMDVWMGG